MIDPDLRLQKPLEDYIELWERLSSRSVELVIDAVSEDFSFSDPFHYGRGTQQAHKIMCHRINVFPSLHYRVHDFMWGRQEATAYLYWTMHYTVNSGGILRKRSNDLDIEGMTQLKFLPAGQIFSHQEFWGAYQGADFKSYARDLFEKSKARREDKV
tara:strand:- start:35 stop:505 length:471 start_codon:yes stop_codon:yes gene_type:complete